MSERASTQYVFIRNKNNTFFLYYQPEQTVFGMKEYLGSMIKKKPEDIKLIYKGQEIQNDAIFKDILSYQYEHKYTKQMVDGLLTKVELFACFRLEDGSFEEPSHHDPELTEVDPASYQAAFEKFKKAYSQSS